MPVDPLAPASRNAYIFNNCSVRTAIVEDQFVGDLRAEMAKLGDVPAFVVTQGTGGGKPLADTIQQSFQQGNATPKPATRPAPTTWPISSTPPAPPASPRA